MKKYFVSRVDGAKCKAIGIADLKAAKKDVFDRNRFVDTINGYVLETTLTIKELKKYGISVSPIKYVYVKID